MEQAFLADANRIDAGQFKKTGRASIGFCFFVKKTWKKAAPQSA
jgi:hypothetical protein